MHWAYPSMVNTQAAVPLQPACRRDVTVPRRRDARSALWLSA